MRSARCVLTFLLAIAPVLRSQGAAASLVVGTREAPPFAMKDGAGAWTGLSIELWQEAARRLGISYELRELGSPESLVDSVANGSVDASVAAITVSAARVGKVDFTQPYFSSGLGIAVRTSEGSGWISVIRAVFSAAFLKVIAALFLVLVGAGAGVWLLERKDNPEQFGGRPAEGLGSAFWWAAVTMTTVGYGDKAPRTVGGRLVALIWMFTSVIIISGFTAQIAASLTVNRLDSAIRGPGDLPRFRVATVGSSFAEGTLQGMGVNSIAYASLEEALAAVQTGNADACVYDAPILNYELRGNGELSMLPATFASQDYAIALPIDSPLRRDLNRVLLEIEEGDLWPAWRQRYLGAAN